MSTPNDKRLFLLDAMALVYRAYFAFAQMRKQRGVGMMNSKGLETSAIMGFTTTLHDLLQRDKPTHIAVVFDAAGPTLRDTEFDFYKANRQEMPDDIRRSLPYIKAIVEAFRIPVLELEGYEADDIIGTLAKKAARHSYEVYMVSPDKDFGQLVEDKVFIYKPPYQGKGDWELLGPDEVKAKWDIARVEQVIDILGLMGDSVDNIPGIAGVGEKTASKLLKEFDSIENLLDNTDKLTGKLREKVEAGADMARISKQLATIITDAPFELEEDNLVMEEPDKERLKELFADLEFRTLGQRILGDNFVVTVKPNAQMSLFGSDSGGVAAANDDGEARTIDNTPHTYTLVEGPDAVSKLADQLRKHKEVCFDTETTGLDALTCGLVGIALSAEPNTGFYIPVPEDEEEAHKVVAALNPLLADEGILKVGQNLKYDLLVLHRYGAEVKGTAFDTMIAHYLVEPDLRHGMDYLAETYLGYHPVGIEELIGKKGKGQKSMRDVDLEKVKEYAAEDADITLQLKGVLEPMLKKDEVEKLFHEVEMPVMWVLADMERAGVRLDSGFLQNFSKELAEDQLASRDKVYELAGMEFNVDSPKQLGEVLFERLKIPYTGQKTKTGQHSTGEEVIGKLAAEYDICRYVLDYRELGKLKSTYVDALPGLANPNTGRVHTTYNQTVANTGRLSSASPNLQNIPIRTERGQQVRKAFIPRDKDHVLFSADYSQIELRIIAALSNDDGMISAFRQKQDIHTATASKVFGVAPGEVDRNMRSKAKAVNFGIAYGQTAFGLGQGLGISRTEAQEIINNYFKEFPGIKRYMDEAIAFARENGYAKTMLGRRRYLKDITSGNQTVRGFAERNAINMPIQGTAADMIKVAMVRIHEAMKKGKMRSKMILQVHDELVFDVPKDELSDLKPLVTELMENALDIGIPVVVESGAGENWLEAH